MSIAELEDKGQRLESGFRRAVKKNTTAKNDAEWNDMLQKPRTQWKRKEKLVEDVKEPEKKNNQPEEKKK
jgi:hypothetical protein